MGDLTPEQKKVRSERARENGRLGGRPPRSPFTKAQKLISAAREKGQAALPAIIDYMLEIVHGEHEDATHDHRIRAGEFIANRCGMPVRTEAMIGTVDHDVRTVNAVGWRDADGVLRDAAGEPVQEH